MLTYDNRSRYQKLKDSLADSYKFVYALSYFTWNANNSLEQK